jgi:hypothetical protein
LRAGKILCNKNKLLRKLQADAVMQYADEASLAAPDALCLFAAPGLAAQAKSLHAQIRRYMQDWQGTG